MSHELDVTLPILGLGVSDDTLGLKKIKKQMHLAIIRGITKAVETTIQLALLIVPESHPNDTNPRPYPGSYETEQLMYTYIDELNSSLRRMKRGKTTLRKSYTIQQLGWDYVSYSDPVNKMTNVNWTKKTSESRFKEKLCQLLQKLIPLMVEQELQAIDRGQQLLYGAVT